MAIHDRRRLQVWADRDICIGSGMCAMHAPATFDVGAEGTVIIADEITESADAVRVAVEACPTGALRLGPAGQGEEGTCS